MQLTTELLEIRMWNAGKYVNVLDIMPSKASMRVIGGTAKGRRIRGTLSPKARPTTERVRSAIFNILDPYTFIDQKVLDLFAGSGSLGIEALSQGAAWVDFVEIDNNQCQVIQSNLEGTGFKEKSSIRCGDVNRVLPRLEGPYRLVMLDPPYRLETTANVIQSISDSDQLLEVGSTVIVGHSRHTELAETYGSLYLESHRRYGDNVLEFYSKR
ncbi:MAG: 16S rRNA (guanine(966)-N(2))-methyltransferase RsmD [Dehalococcoidia bacterium]|nr:16S rRNA (guanine(966)-N(2))-methyltransferase RsmD [Dehalococcoidia bacterium]